MRLESIDSQKVRTLCNQYHFSLLLVFGSHANGTAHAQSDLDIAALPEKPDVKIDKLKLICDLELIFNKPVDLVILTLQTDSLLLYEVYSNCHVLHESVPDLCVTQYIRALKLYWDTAPFREMEKRYLKSYVEENQ